MSLLANLFFGGKFGSGGEAVFVDVADVGDLDSFELGEVVDVGFAPAQSHDSDTEFLTGLGIGAGGRDKRGGSGSANEVATALHWGTLDASSDDASFSERLGSRQTKALGGHSEGCRGEGEGC